MAGPFRQQQARHRSTPPTEPVELILHMVQALLLLPTGQLQNTANYLEQALPREGQELLGVVKYILWLRDEQHLSQLPPPRPPS